MSRAQKMDRRAAREAVYHDPTENPFIEGTRLHRYYEKELIRYNNMQSLVEEMEVVYGAIGTPAERRPLQLDLFIQYKEGYNE